MTGPVEGRVDLGYWRSFVTDLLVGFPLRAVRCGALGLVLGLACFYLLNFGLLAGQSLHPAARWAIGAFTLAWYLLAGLASGCALATLETAWKKLNELDRGVRAVLDQLMEQVMAHVPGADRALPIDQLDGRVAAAIEEMTSRSRQEFSLLSVVGAPARLLLWLVLHSTRVALRWQIGRSLGEPDGTDLTASTIERFFRGGLIDAALGRFHTALLLYTAQLGGAVLVTLGLPFALLFWVGSPR